MDINLKSISLLCFSFYPIRKAIFDDLSSGTALRKSTPLAVFKLKISFSSLPHSIFTDQMPVEKC
jgi:hypothetical protein